MKLTRKMYIIGSIGLAVVIVTGALAVASSRKQAGKTLLAVEQHSVSRTELAKADGKNGHDCYVAVSGTVYLIKDFSLWQNGKHTSSNGLAYCGADLTNVIDKAPHGRKILDILPKVGPLVG